MEKNLIRNEEKTLPEIVVDLKKKRRKEILHGLNQPIQRNAGTQRGKYLKRYNLSQTAEVLEVPRQTVYYWIKKGWKKLSLFYSF